MRNLLLAAATGFALTLTAAPSFAADATPAAAPATKQDQNAASKGGTADQCAAILADKASHSDADVKACEKTK